MEWAETKAQEQENAGWMWEEQQFAWNNWVQVKIGGQGEKLDQDLVFGDQIEGSGGSGANEWYSRAGSYRQCSR